jgi:serine-type D-Ala-D-Ala carboxypeptidase/endopeptidase (penicillin-binding protein 4)
MLQLFASGLANSWLNNTQILSAPYDPAPLVSTWQGLPLLNPPQAAEAPVRKSIEQYLQTLKTMGMDPQKQGIWLQTDSINLIDYQGQIPLPAASLTKTSTTLAALKTWGINKRFDTSIGITGKVQQEILNGDLVIQGAGDPLFVWEDAQALAAALHQMGIQQINGNLVIIGNFAMNYQKDPQKAGELLKQGLSGVALPQNLLKEQLKDVNVIKMPAAKLSTLGKFQVPVMGQVLIADQLPPQAGAILRHHSLPLLDILREMNIYSNNEIAQMLADGVGGHEVVMKIAAQSAGFTPTEIQLTNGSGLGMTNQIAPHAVSQIFRTIHGLVQLQGLTAADLFPSSGLDNKGSLLDRHLPLGTTVKTGTLNEVSALTGALPTRDRGLVWFTIINRGAKIAELRQQQDKLLQTLLSHWGKTATIPGGIQRRNLIPPYLGDPQRNEILVKLPLTDR